MNKKLVNEDDHQRHLALDTTKSFIIQAPAGSGKTELLIQRFLKLLNQVQKPEEIIALTFTKKAANEMRERIIKALNDAHNGKVLSSTHQQLTYNLAKLAIEKDNLLGWNLLSNPNQLRIQTIDSLCSFITKQLPILSTFGSQPHITNHPQYIYQDAVQEILSHVEEKFSWSEDIAKLLLHFDNDLPKLSKLLVKLISKRDQWLPYIKLHSTDMNIKYQLESSLKKVIQSALNNVINCFPKHLVADLISIVQYAASNLTNSEAPINDCLYLTKLPSLHYKNLNTWRNIANLLLTDKHSWRQKLDIKIGFPPASTFKNTTEKNFHKDFKQRATDLISSLSQYDELHLAFKKLSYLPDPAYNDHQWEILQSLLHILKLISAQLRVSFQKHNTIDFIENAQAALAALGTEEQPTDLALSIDYKIQHLLVDEFQDTSITQYQLLEKLVTGWEPQDGRTLFVVGDPMQSIYRFREAEVGLFMRMKEHGIVNIKPISLILKNNFRSNRNIVEWNNKHFSGIFPTYDDIESGAVSYCASIANRPTQASSVQIKAYLNGDDSTQAEQVVNCIKTLREQQPTSKIAVLTRTRSHLSGIIVALQSANISYQAIDIDPLVSRQYIQDLLSLTSALLHLADRIAWLSILRAPWCGLTLNDLYILSGDTANSILWERLQNQDIIKQLSHDGQSRLNKILPILVSTLTNRGRINLRDWIESTWILLGGPAILNNQNEMNDIHTYFTVLTEFSHNDLFQSIDKFKEQLATEFVSTNSNSDLQLMTIHSAKGLEFDTVIIPHLERTTRPDDHEILTWIEKPTTDNNIALFLSAKHAIGATKDSIYQYIYELHKAKLDYELSRLLYVATTRAKNNLYLFFNIDKNSQNEYSLPHGSFLHKLWPMIKNTANEIININSDITQDYLKNTIPKRVIKRFVPTWINHIIDKTQKLYVHQQIDGFRINNQTPKLIGIITHLILQQISQFGINWWQARPLIEQKQYLRQQVKLHKVLVNDHELAVNHIFTSIKQMLNDQRGIWILHAHKNGQSELSLTTYVDDQIEDLRIDRTFIDDHNVRWIIDYKTTTFTQDDLSQFLIDEQEKYLSKMQKYAQAMHLLEKREIKLGLYFPALPAWHEWSY